MMVILCRCSPLWNHRVPVTHCSDGHDRDEAQQVLRNALMQLCWADIRKQSGSEDGSLVSLASDVIADIAAFFTRRLLQHYALYSLVFTKEQHHVRHQYHLTVSIDGLVKHCLPDSRAGRCLDLLPMHT